MLATKQIDGNYTITVRDPDQASRGDIILDTGSAVGTVTLTGDLNVLGTTTSIGTVDLEVTDNIITVNFGEVGPGVFLGSAGLEVARGDGIDPAELTAYIKFDETAGLGATPTWVVDKGDGIEVEILTGPPGATVLTDIVQDLSPQLGANLDVNGFEIVALINTDLVLRSSGTGQIQATGPLVLATTTVPGNGEVLGNTTALYTGADTGGETRIHYKTDTDTTGELISKTKAIAYAMIL